ncbi:hypothetical protein Agub_g3021 [Astrephomene gubernaculifera]|uniref:Cyclic nucleotide-binding domain-containing protein n=1 Tax=Astrephomene gubernaculifera TaxID=47775 RepID=A0AAD3HIB2_9CHLO|nr:hypothetical protein Agub_g3021 [Astrephomene gubernaculifera]
MRPSATDDSLGKAGPTEVVADAPGGNEGNKERWPPARPFSQASAASFRVPGGGGAAGEAVRPGLRRAYLTLAPEARTESYLEVMDEVLVSAPALSRLTRSARLAVARKAHVVEFPPGAALCTRGAPQECILVVMSGEVEVVEGRGNDLPAASSLLAAVTSPPARPPINPNRPPSPPASSRDSSPRGASRGRAGGREEQPTSPTTQSPASPSRRHPHPHHHHPHAGLRISPDPLLCLGAGGLGGTSPPVSPSPSPSPTSQLPLPLPHPQGGALPLQLERRHVPHPAILQHLQHQHTSQHHHHLHQASLGGHSGRYQQQLSRGGTPASPTPPLRQPHTHTQQRGRCRRVGHLRGQQEHQSAPRLLCCCCRCQQPLPPPPPAPHPLPSGHLVGAARRARRHPRGGQHRGVGGWRWEPQPAARLQAGRCQHEQQPQRGQLGQWRRRRRRAQHQPRAPAPPPGHIPASPPALPPAAAVLPGRGGRG